MHLNDIIYIYKLAHNRQSTLVCSRRMVTSDSPVVSSPQREHSVEPSPPLASAAPPPPFFSGPSPGRHAGTPGRPRPAAASALVSGSSPPWGRTFELILRLWLFELQAYEFEI